MEDGYIQKHMLPSHTPPFNCLLYGYWKYK